MPGESEVRRQRDELGAVVGARLAAAAPAAARVAAAAAQSLLGRSCRNAVKRTSPSSRSSRGCARSGRGATDARRGRRVGIVAGEAPPRGRMLIIARRARVERGGWRASRKGVLRPTGTTAPTLRTVDVASLLELGVICSPPEVRQQHGTKNLRQRAIAGWAVLVSQ